MLGQGVLSSERLCLCVPGEQGGRARWLFRGSPEQGLGPRPAGRRGRGPGEAEEGPVLGEVLICCWGGAPEPWLRVPWERC